MGSTATGDTDPIKEFKKAFTIKFLSTPREDKNVILDNTKITGELMRRFLNRIMLNVTQCCAGKKHALSFEEWTSHLRNKWEFERSNYLYNTCEVINSKRNYEDKNSLVYYFETNHEIPYKVLDELYYQWNNLTFENQYFSFEDMGLEGYQFAKDGNLIEFKDANLKFDEDGYPIFEILPKNLLDEFGWF